MSTHPIRKRNRLENYDYSQPGAYFITVCSKDKRWIFWNVGASTARPGSTAHLSLYGRIADEKIREIVKRYRFIKMANYVVMPNHIHLLLTNCFDDSGRAMLAPTPNISNVIRQFKGAVTKKTHISLWQKSFHDRIIRNEKEFLNYCEYIDNNPLKWKDDEFYIT